jgi:predicted nucleic-acid-binding Zn-ribbon protein
VRDGDTILMIRCPKCGRIKQHGVFVRVVGRQLLDIVDLIYKQKIRFIDEDCGRHKVNETGR